MYILLILSYNDRYRYSQNRQSNIC
ncbi:Hypothetical protein CFV354_1002 [Campylobacter fetus subsp. venerealis NCTC 10354]|nr:Hypothetical protein CFV354_1002 [Campylobacter fetus subsp. venerealis NCTC 10354]